MKLLMAKDNFVWHDFNCFVALCIFERIFSISPSLCSGFCSSLTTGSGGLFFDLAQQLDAADHVNGLRHIESMNNMMYVFMGIPV